MTWSTIGAALYYRAQEIAECQSNIREIELMDTNYRYCINIVVNITMTMMMTILKQSIHIL